MSTTRKTYTEEFQREAVALMEQSGNKSHLRNRLARAGQGRPEFQDWFLELRKKANKIHAELEIQSSGSLS